MKSVRIALVFALLVGVLVVTSVASADPVRRFKPGEETIATIAVTSGNFDTLVAALTCTNLVGAVADPDAELTVFAPTDAAFGDLNAGNICTAIDTDTLTTILLYHVVGERRPSPSVINGRNKQIEMLAGGSIYPDGERSLVVRDNLGSAINIQAADVMASNGIIHVIDGVLLPFDLSG